MQAVLDLMQAVPVFSQRLLCNCMAPDNIHANPNQVHCRFLGGRDVKTKILLGLSKWGGGGQTQNLSMGRGDNFFWNSTLYASS